MYINDPETFTISWKDRKRFLYALKKVVDDAHFEAPNEEHEITYDKKGWEDSGHQQAIFDLIRVLGGSITISYDVYIPESITLQRSVRLQLSEDVSQTYVVAGEVEELMDLGYECEFCQVWVDKSDGRFPSRCILSIMYDTGEKKKKSVCKECFSRAYRTMKD